MISILKIGRTTFVLANKELSGTPGVFEATVLHRQEDVISEVVVPLMQPKVRADGSHQIERRYSLVSGGKKNHLEEALKRIRRFKSGTQIHELCLAYEREIRLNSPVGETCHSSAWKFLVKSGTKGRPLNGHVYGLIAWAITYCSLDVSDTYPITYVPRGE